MLITENHLDDGVRGDSREAQGVIVELVWRLVATRSPRPKERRFPLGDSIGQHGPDGFLETELSLWSHRTQAPMASEVCTSVSSLYDEMGRDSPGEGFITEGVSSWEERCCMVEKLDPKEMVSVEEVAVSNMWEIAALAEQLEQKGC